MNVKDPVELALAVARGLKRVRHPCALCGGLALAVWGEPRETRDADFAVLGIPGKEALAALNGVGLKGSITFESKEFGGLLLSRTAVWFPGRREVNTIDWVRPRHQPYARTALARAQSAPVRGRKIVVLSPEDLVLFKVLSTRDLDIEDAASVLRRSAGRLNLRRIGATARSLARALPDWDVAGRLRRVKTAASRSCE